MPVIPRLSIRRFWKPAASTGAVGTAIAVWFEEILLYIQEILTLGFFAFVGMLMYFFNVYLFNSQTPRREDIYQPNRKGEKE